MTTRKKKTVVPKKKVDIFSLYTHEKIITIEDNLGNEVKILFVKPTQGERQRLLENYINILANTRQDMLKKDQESGYYTRTINTLSREHVIEGIMNYQKSQRTEVMDLYPLPEVENMKEEEVKKFQEDLLKKWEKGKLEELEKMTLEDLRKELSNITIEGLSLIESGRQFDYISLQAMCLDPDTKEKIFATPEDVERVRDHRIIDKLLEELNDFRSAENMKEIRGKAEDKDFLASGESQKK